MRRLVAPALAALLLLGGPACAADDEASVTTEATARDRLPNTEADVTLSVTTRARTIGAAQSALAEGSTTLLGWLRTTRASQLRTGSVTVQPELDPAPPPGQPPRIVGYSGRLSVGFRVPAEELGATLSGALAHGANEVAGLSQHPAADSVDAMRSRLAAAATRVALAEASAVAEAAGSRPGPVRRVVVSAAQPGFRPMMAARAASVPGSAPPIATEAGDTEVTATVTLTLGLLPGS